MRPSPRGFAGAAAPSARRRSAARSSRPDAIPGRPATATPCARPPARSRAAGRPACGRLCATHRRRVGRQLEAVERSGRAIPNRITAGARGDRVGRVVSARERRSEPVRNTRSPGTPNGSRLVASRRSSGHPRRSSSASRAQTFDQVLAVVEHEQESGTRAGARGRRRADRCAGARARRGRRATALTTSWSDRTRGQVDQPRTIRRLRGLSGGDLDRQPRLSRSAGARSR